MEDFVKIYTGYLKDVYRFLLKLSGNPDVAEELTQVTFAAAFEHLDQFKGNCKISVWLCQIAKHEYYAYYRKSKRFAEKEVSEEYGLTGSFESAEDNVIRKEEQMRILEILQGIPEPYQEVFTLHIIGEVSYRDISRLFGKSESWARVTYYRAKSMIIERLGGGEDDAV